MWPHFMHRRVQCSKPERAGIARWIAIRAWHLGQRGRWASGNSGGDDGRSDMASIPARPRCRLFKTKLGHWGSAAAAVNSLDGGHAPGYQLPHLWARGRKCLTRSTTLLSPPTWRASPPWSHPISGLAYFGTAAFAVRLLRLDQKVIDGIPMNPRRMANTLNTKPELLREFCGHFTKPGDETVVLFADGRAVEISMF
jgi:hypothetical protein